jgi:hypothetical protein
VFPLACVWDDAGRFRQLQATAKRCKAVLERRCRAIVAGVREDADGAWFCSAALADVEGAVASAGGALAGQDCWLPQQFLAGAACCRRPCGASRTASFDAFRAVLRDALPPGTWVEPDDGEDAAGARARPGDVALRVRCLRRKSIKAVPRLRAKVIAAQVAAAAKAGTAAEGSASWPFTATVGDVLRASVSAVDAAGVRRAWECLERSEALQVFKLKNKFRKAAAEIDDPDSTRTTFPNLHANVLFRAPGCAPIVAEVQVHHEGVLGVAKQDHKLYFVARTSTFGASSRPTSTT